MPRLRFDQCYIPLHLIKCVRKRSSGESTDIDLEFTQVCEDQWRGHHHSDGEWVPHIPAGSGLSGGAKVGESVVESLQPVYITFV